MVEVEGERENALRGPRCVSLSSVAICQRHPNNVGMEMAACGARAGREEGVTRKFEVSDVLLVSFQDILADQMTKSIEEEVGRRREREGVDAARKRDMDGHEGKAGERANARPSKVAHGQ